MKNFAPVSAFPIASRLPNSPHNFMSSAVNISAAAGTAATNSRLARKLTPANAALTSNAARLFSGVNRPSPAAIPVKVFFCPPFSSIDS